MKAISEYVLGFYDGPHATPKEVDHGPVFLGIKNVTPDGRLDLSDIRHVSEQEFPRWTKRVKPQLGDVVFSYEATLHRYALIPEGFEGCLGRRMALIRPDPNKLNSRFLHFYLLSPGWRNQVDGNVITGATVNRLPLTKVPSFTVEFPSLAKQKEISAILAAYDDLIENNRRRIALLEEAARQLYKEWFVHFRFPGHEHVKIIDGVPEGWALGCVGDFYATSSGGTPSRKVPEYFHGTINWVKTGELQGGFILQTEEKITEQAVQKSSAKLFPRQTVLVAMYGATIAQLGILASDAACNQACCSLRPAHPAANFVYAYLFLEQSREGLIGLGKGSAQNNISQTIIREFPMVMPLQQISSAFYDIVEPIFRQIEILQMQNRRLARARDLLLPKLMSGGIAV